MNFSSEPHYLTQVHGTNCVPAYQASKKVEADASFTAKRKEVLTVLVADCVPVLFSSKDGTRVGALMRVGEAWQMESCVEPFNLLVCCLFVLGSVPALVHATILSNETYLISFQMT